MEKVEKETVMEPPAKEGHCHYFLLRKKRHCRMTVKPGEVHCPEHKFILQGAAGAPPQDESLESGQRRIPCPYDPKHSCYADALRKHMRRCNARPKDMPAYYAPSINAGNDDDSDVLRVPLSSIDDEKLMSFIQKIEDVYQGIDGACEEQVLSHPGLDEELCKSGSSARKHLKQTSSILGYLEELGLSSPATCYVEFGSGRGQLSYWLTQVVVDPSKSWFVLVDRDSHRHKCDNRLKDDTALTICRIRIDIEHLDLAKIDAVAKSARVVGISKHLCGKATDMALRCLAESKSGNINGIIMALCCHHRCEWKSYVGKGFFKDHGFTVADFNILCSVASWATCGNGRSRFKLEPIEKEEMSARYENLQLSYSRREEIGKKCKALLDYGRMQYLENYGFKGGLRVYIPKHISPENVLLLATKDISSP